MNSWAARNGYAIERANLARKVKPNHDAIAPVTRYDGAYSLSSYGKVLRATIDENESLWRSYGASTD